jgi:D-aminopeptidase
MLSVDFDERKIDAIFRDVNQCHLPGAAVGIGVRGKPVYRKGFGLASMELPVALSPRIRMRIASVTKHFTCLTWMLLCEEGKAGLDEPIGGYLPELNPVARRVTVRQLMGHLGGLRDSYDICRHFHNMGPLIRGEDQLALYCAIDDVNAPPAGTWNYNNGAYVLLSTAIERVTGRSLADVLRERIFEPVGMRDTLLHAFDDRFLPNSATLHMTSRDGHFERSNLGTTLAGDGGIVSTIDDMLRWLAHMDAPVVGTAATWRTMKSPQTLENGTSTGYGLGLITDHYRGVETLSHGGSLMGCNSQMLKVPAAGLDIVVMVNRRDVVAIELANKILDTCIPSLAAGSEPPKRACTTGVFRSPTSGRVIELKAEDGQQIVSIDGLDWPFAQGDDGVLRPLPWLSFYKQTVTVLEGTIRFSDFGNCDELIRVRRAADADASRITGQYRSDTLGIQITIACSATGARLEASGRLGSAVYELKSLSDDIWRARSPSMMPWGGVLSFHQDGTFSFTTSRNRALMFRRTA